MDTHLGVHFGTRAVFTYGPLGFLTTPYDLFYPGLTLWSIAAQLAMATSYFGLLIYAARKVISAPVAVIVALIAGAPAVVVWSGSDALSAIGLFIVLVLLRSNDDDPAVGWWWVGLGVLLGVGALEKASVAVEVGVLGLLALLTAPKRRGVRTAALPIVTVVVVFAIGWFGTGNGVDNLIPYIRSTISVTSGYTAAMYTRTFGPPTYQYWLVGLFVLVAGYLAWMTHPPIEKPQWVRAAWRSWLPLLRAVAVGLSLAFTLWVLFKYGVVKQGLRVLFLCLPLILAALIFKPFVRSRWSPDPMALVGVVVASAICAFITLGPIPAQIVSPFGDSLNLAKEVRDLASPTRSQALVSRNRQSLVAAYAIPPGMLAEMSGKTVDIDPWEDEVAYAYPQLRWDSLPVLQDYSAYTTYLDQLDASFLGSRQAPQFILKQPPGVSTIDFRVAQLDPPETQIAIDCYYHQVQVSEDWQLLERGPDRCGRPFSLGTVSTGFGRQLEVPSAPRGDMVAATFSLRVPLSWKLLNLIYRPYGLNAYLNGNTAPNRLLVPTASDMHLMRPPADLGFGPRFSPAAIGSLVLTFQHHAATESGVTVHFFAIPYF